MQLLENKNTVQSYPIVEEEEYLPAALERDNMNGDIKNAENRGET